MECLIITYGRNFQPMAEISFDSYMILEFQAMSTCWPNVHCFVLPITLKRPFKSDILITQQSCSPKQLIQYSLSIFVVLKS